MQMTKEATLAVWAELSKQYKCHAIMAEDGTPSGRWMTGAVRIAFPALFKARVDKESGKTAFSATLLFAPGADIEALKLAVRETATAKWPGITPAQLQLPFADQAMKAATAPAYAKTFTTGVYINASSQFAPAVLLPSGDVVTSESKAFYAGLLARVKLNAYAWEYKGKRGVSFGLIALQKLADGERWGGAGEATDGFGAVAGAVPNPMANGSAAPASAPNPNVGW